MTKNQPTPGQTLAVLLGASKYRFAPKLAQGPAFYNSSQQFEQYLTDTMGVPQENVKSFFDETRSAADQLEAIRHFIDRRKEELEVAGKPARDLIVHYVGHGLFSGGDNAYCLAIRTTGVQAEGFTSIRISDLSAVISASANLLRKYLILDCCFSAAAYSQFQSGPLQVARVKVREVLDDDSPERGTTLLCSANANDPSIAPPGLPRTMFSDTLLNVLTTGHKAFGPQLSLLDVGELVRAQIKETYRDMGVRPEVHSPDQRSGDVARIPMFPNPAWASKGVPTVPQEQTAYGETEAKAVAEQKAREEAARRDAEGKAVVLQKAREEATRREAEAKAAAEQKAREEAARRDAEAKAVVLQKAREEATRREAEAKAAVEQKAREEAARRDAEAKAVVLQKAREEATRREAEARQEAEKKLTTSDYVVRTGVFLFLVGLAGGMGNATVTELAKEPSGTNFAVLVVVALISGGIGAASVPAFTRLTPVFCAVVYLIAFLYTAANTPGASTSYGIVFDIVALGLALLWKPKVD